MAPTKLHLDSSPIINEPSSAKVIVEMPGNNDEAFCRTCSDDVSLAVKTLDEATQTVRDLLAGRSQETEIFSSTDKHIRSAVGAELLAAQFALGVAAFRHPCVLAIFVACAGSAGEPVSRRDRAGGVATPPAPALNAAHWRLMRRS